MLHAIETWPLTKPSLQGLQQNDRAMTRQICNVKPQDTATIKSTELLALLGIEDLDLILIERRLRWYGHVEHSNGAVKTAFDIQRAASQFLEGDPLLWIRPLFLHVNQNSDDDDDDDNDTHMCILSLGKTCTFHLEKV